MKKFLITLLILIIAGGVVFYFGWIQIQVPAEGYVVFFSKTNGYDDRIIKPGEFVWRWQRLIPKNVTLYTFEPEPEESTVTVTGTLPSGSFYSRYLEGDPEFSWEADIFLRYSLKPESLPALVRDNHITPETLPDYFKTVRQKVEAFAFPRIVNHINTAGSSGTIYGDITRMEEQLSESLAASFPHLDFFDIHLVSFDFPDMELYGKGKQYYNQITDLEQRIRREEISNAAAEEAERNRGLSLLKEYGKVLTDYPVLMDYLELKGDFSGITSAENSRALPVLPEAEEQ